MSIFPSYLALQATQLRQSQRLYFISTVFLVTIFLFNLCCGTVWIAPTHWLLPENHMLIWQLRVPRAMAVLTVGGALACSGAVMQALFNNPLAEPGLLGVSNGAGLGMVITTLLLGNTPIATWILSTNAIIGAMLITFILLIFTLRKRISNTRLLLVGVSLSIIGSALMTWCVYFSQNRDLRQLLYWLMGGFGGVDWQQKWLILLLLPGFAGLFYQAKQLNTLALGELQAQQLGFSLSLWRTFFIIIVSWMVGISVAIAGVISFIGFIIPHLLRLRGITDHRHLLPLSAIVGASILLLSDLIARIGLYTAELPIGVITATIGTPIFIWILIHSIDL